MKIARSILLEFLKTAKDFTAKRLILSVLECVNFKDLGDKLVLTVTDLEKIYSKSIIDYVNTQGIEEFSISFNKLNVILKNIDSEFISFTKEGKVINLIADSDIFNFGSVEDIFPPNFDVSYGSFTISSKDLSQHLSTVINSVSLDTTKFLNNIGFNINPDSTLSICGTDGKLLSYYTIPIKSMNIDLKNLSSSFTAPINFFQSILNKINSIKNDYLITLSFGLYDNKFQYLYDNKFQYLRLEINQEYFYTRLVEGTYLNYMKIVNCTKNYPDKNIVTVETKEFLKKINLVKNLSEKNSVVYLSIKENKLLLFSDVIKYQGICEKSTVKGDTFNFIFHISNNLRLLDSLNTQFLNIIFKHYDVGIFEVDSIFTLESNGLYVIIMPTR